MKVEEARYVNLRDVLTQQKATDAQVASIMEDVTDDVNCGDSNNELTLVRASDVVEALETDDEDMDKEEQVLRGVLVSLISGLDDGVLVNVE